MELTKELLEQRIEALEAQRQQFVANVNACAGALQVVRDLLGELDREKPVEVDTEDGGGADDSPAPSEGEE